MGTPMNLIRRITGAESRERIRHLETGLQNACKERDEALQELNKQLRPDHLSCTFCGKFEHRVWKLCDNGGRSYICNECVDLCAEVLLAEKDA